MPDVRVFRNDGDELFVDDPSNLAYIDPGVVLLYADTANDVVCSYFEGHLGQPIQGTVECAFADEIDLAAVRPALEELDVSGFSVAMAPLEDTASARWALDGLTEEPLRLADPERDAIRRAVETADTGGFGRSWLPNRPLRSRINLPSVGDAVNDALLASANTGHDQDGERKSTSESADTVVPPRARSEGNGAADSGSGREHNGGSWADGTADRDGPTLDFKVRSTYDAARFFAFLVDTLADTGLTVAVSKAGRVDAIADADVVIHPDGNLPPDSRVEPLPATRDRLNVERAAVARTNAREALAAPVTDLVNAFRDTTANPAVDDTTGEAVLRELLDERLAPHSSLAVVDRWRSRYRRVRVAVVAALLGVLVGVLSAESIRLAAWRVETTARQLAATDPAVLRALVIDAATDTNTLVIPVGSVLMLVAVLVVHRRQRGDTSTRERRPSTVRSDLLRLARITLIIVALVGLLASIGLLRAS